MTLEHDIRRLAAIPLLAELDVEALRLIAFSAETRMFQPGDILFREGEIADGGFIVLVGKVEIEGSAAGPQSRQMVGPGALIGERALISAIARPATATVREPSTLLKITRRLFYRVLSEFPGNADRLRGALARDLAQNLSGGAMAAVE